LARGFTGRRKVIKMEGCYHGSHDYVLIKSGSGALTHGVPSSPGIPEEVSETVRIAKYNNMESVKEIFDNEPEGIAALIIEPIMANAGVILPENGFLRELRRITSENGSLLIFDEVVTGFRFHYGAYSSIRQGLPGGNFLRKPADNGCWECCFG
ncbi:MAG: aminotransferase class III-fold pyridoxal phosphate-dependent enzyme, partial [Candidatus Thermoplasmatota archaeon]|nr:aminotransferase class III-fold pyridoxal phosphate-dependent enzyme [Candidatus Thermoplasmatota archaeon]